MFKTSIRNSILTLLLATSSSGITEEYNSDKHNEIRKFLEYPENSLGDNSEISALVSEQINNHITLRNKILGDINPLSEEGYTLSDSYIKTFKDEYTKFLNETLIDTMTTTIDKELFAFYDKHYTYSEMKRLNEFWGSKLGRKVTSLDSDVADISYTAAYRILEVELPKFMEVFNAKIEKEGIEIISHKPTKSPSSWFVMGEHKRCVNFNNMNAMHLDWKSINTPSELVDALQVNGISSSLTKSKRTCNQFILEITDKKRWFYLVQNESCNEIIDSFQQSNNAGKTTAPIDNPLSPSV